MSPEQRTIAVFGDARFPFLACDVTDDWPPMPDELDRPWTAKAHTLKLPPPNAP